MKDASVLVVEDENIVALNLQNRLTSLGYRVTAVVSSGEEALVKAEENPPDIVLMDIMLKGELDGIDTAQRMRKRFDVPVVFLTAYADDSTLDRAKVIEPHGYMLKPFELREIKTTIEIALYRHEMERRLKESEQRYSLAVSGANDGIWDWNRKTNTVYFSPRWKAMLGYADDEIQDLPEEWFSRVHEEDREQLQVALSRHIDGITPALEEEYRMLHKDGKYRWVFTRGVAVKDEKGNSYRMAGSTSDVTRRRASEEKVLYFAYYDSLTDLPNQVLFQDKLWEFMRQKKVGSHFAIFHIGIDNYNDVCASDTPILANLILVEVARRLRASAAGCQFFARFLGPDFNAIIPAEHLESELKRISDALSIPFETSGKKIEIRYGIGVAKASPKYENADEMLRDACFALNQVRGQNKFKLFDD